MTATEQEESGQLDVPEIEAPGPSEVTVADADGADGLESDAWPIDPNLPNPPAVAPDVSENE